MAAGGSSCARPGGLARRIEPGSGAGCDSPGRTAGQSAPGLELHDLRRAGRAAGLQSGQLQSGGARDGLQRLGRQRRLEGDQIGQFDIVPQPGSARSHDGLMEVVGSIRKRLDRLPRQQPGPPCLLAAMGGRAVQLRQILTERIGMQRCGRSANRPGEPRLAARWRPRRADRAGRRARRPSPSLRATETARTMGSRSGVHAEERSAAFVERAPELWSRGHSRVCAIIARAARKPRRTKNGRNYTPETFNPLTTPQAVSGNVRCELWCFRLPIQTGESPDALRIL